MQVSWDKRIVLCRTSLNLLPPDSESPRTQKQLAPGHGSAEKADEGEGEGEGDKADGHQAATLFPLPFFCLRLTAFSFSCRLFISTGTP